MVTEADHIMMVIFLPNRITNSTPMSRQSERATKPYNSDDFQDACTNLGDFVDKVTSTSKTKTCQHLAINAEVTGCIFIKHSGSLWTHTERERFVRL